MHLAYLPFDWFSVNNLNVNLRLEYDQGVLFRFVKGLTNFCWFKGIVHPKMKMWCLSAYPKGIQDVGDFVSSVEHKQRFLTQTVAVCQSYNVVNGTHGFESKRKHTQTCQSTLTRHALDVVNTLRTVGLCGGSEVKNYINTVKFLAQTDRFVS